MIIYQKISNNLWVLSYEKILGRNDELVSQLEEANEKNKELYNASVGLKATTETYPQEIDRYVAKEKDLREFIEKQQVTIAEKESYLDAAVKQKIQAKTEAEKLLSELNRYKDELDKNKKGLSNLRKVEQSRDRLLSKVNELEETGVEKADNFKRRTNKRSRETKRVNNRKTAIKRAGKGHLQKVWFHSLCCCECCWCGHWCYRF